MRPPTDCEHPEDRQAPLPYVGRAPDPDEWECLDCGTWNMKSRPDTSLDALDLRLQEVLDAKAADTVERLGQYGVWSAEVLADSMSDLSASMSMSTDELQRAFNKMKEAFSPFWSSATYSKTISPRDSALDAAYDLQAEYRKRVAPGGRCHWEIGPQAMLRLSNEIVGNVGFPRTASRPDLYGIPVTVVGDPYDIKLVLDP